VREAVKPMVIVSGSFSLSPRSIAPYVIGRFERAEAARSLLTAWLSVAVSCP